MMENTIDGDGEEAYRKVIIYDLYKNILFIIILNNYKLLLYIIFKILF